MFGEIILDIDSKCPQCEYGVLVLINTYFPFEEHLQCDCCDSTFVINEQL